METPRGKKNNLQELFVRRNRTASKKGLEERKSKKKARAYGGEN